MVRCSRVTGILSSCFEAVSYTHLDVYKRQHIASVLGYESASQVENVFRNAYECYRDWTYACAYLEKKYKDILIEYRDGEPGMPIQFIRNMPPFKPKLSKKTVARVIELREVEKASFVTIAKELRMTQAKARHTYEMFYHKQVIALIHVLPVSYTHLDVYKRQAVCRGIQ